MHFEHPEYLLALLAVPVLGALYWLALRRKKQIAARIGDDALVAQLTANYSPVRYGLKAALAALAIAVLAVAMANPRRRGSVENFSRTGVDVMLVLDVSKSMLATDVAPSRLDKARQLLYRLVDKLGDDRVGLVLFAGRAYLQMPLTTDHGASKMYIQEAGPNAVPTQGTVISEALRMANGAFNATEHKYKAIVLISDGEDHDPDALKTARQLAENGVQINTIGLGSAEGTTLVDPATHEVKRDADGNVVVSKLNEKALTELSDATGGIYLHLDNIDDVLITLTQRLDSIEKRALVDSEYVNYISYYPWFAGLALVLILGEWFIPERKKPAL